MGVTSNSTYYIMLKCKLVFSVGVIWDFDIVKITLLGLFKVCVQLV